MTRRDALAFLSTLALDKRLNDELASVGPERLIEAAKEAGFHFSWEELVSIIREIKGAGEEVSDEVLELIVGGLTPGEIQEWVGEKLKKLLTL